MTSRSCIYVSEPWRIKPMSLAEAHLVLDHSNALTAKEFFDRIQIKGQVAMLLGGGAADLSVFIQTEDGKLVRVDLDPTAAKRLALALLNYGGDA
jgi:hypothetical protein